MRTINESKPDSNWIEAGNKLRELRNGRKLSIFKVAKEVGISGNYISQLERGLKCPSDEVLHSLARFYSIDKHELFSLYGRVCKEETDYILANPPFHKTLTQISIDDKLTEEEKAHLSIEIHKLYTDITKKRGD